MLNNLRITQRYVIVLCAFWLSLVAIIGVSFWGLSSARDSLKTVHAEAMHRALLADQSIDLIVQNRLQVLLAFQHAPESALISIHNHPTNMHLEAIAANRSPSAAPITTPRSSWSCSMRTTARKATSVCAAPNSTRPAM